MTRSFVVGQAGVLFRRIFNVVCRAQEAAIQVMRPGRTLAEVDTVARRVLRESGLLMYGHGSGHGLGLDIHEAPFIKPNAQEVLEVGHVLTIEPGVYLPSRLGVRLEDDILVTSSGPRVLTRKGPHSFTLPCA
jgi:Xaa-Pro aminopeptidase